MLVPWLAPVLVAGMLLFDSLAFFHAWGGMRQREAGALAVDLPQAPGAWQVRYARMGRITLSDTAAYGSVSLTDIASTAPESGIAGVSLPCGLTSSGLPIGLQLQAPPFQEERLLRAAHMYQQETDWHGNRPTFGD